ncbi:hypothetical protein M9Y10_015731 [Tritrichomonas musculus]|uniref:Right handed beta helix domain-containing protein n=1 Tax=Tritrichomonas musculus TaxID=1915356 RepID=A0ABR2L304_9EUKA
MKKKLKEHSNISRDEEGYEYLYNNTFVNCSTWHGGGGIFVYCGDVKTRRSIQDSDESQYAIVITHSNFTDCKSEIEGGTISSGIIVNGKAEGDNDMEIEETYFIRCKSGRGGALYFQDCTKEGEEETILRNCQFIDCYVTGEAKEGYDIYCKSYRITLTGCIFKDHLRGSKVKTSSIEYIETNEAEVAPKPQLFNI